MSRISSFSVMVGIKMVWNRPNSAGDGSEKVVWYVFRSLTWNCHLFPKHCNLLSGLPPWSTPSGNLKAHLACRRIYFFAVVPQAPGATIGSRFYLFTWLLKLTASNLRLVQSLALVLRILNAERTGNPT